MHSSCLQTIFQDENRSVGKNAVHIKNKSGDIFKKCEDIHSPLFLVISPFINPGALYHFKMSFIGLFPLSHKTGYLQDPFKQFSKTDAVDLAFIEISAKTFI